MQKQASLLIVKLCTFVFIYLYLCFFFTQFSLFAYSLNTLTVFLPVDGLMDAHKSLREEEMPNNWLSGPILLFQTDRWLWHDQNSDLLSPDKCFILCLSEAIAHLFLHLFISFTFSNHLYGPHICPLTLSIDVMMWCYYVCDIYFTHFFYYFYVSHLPVLSVKYRELNHSFNRFNVFAIELHLSCRTCLS